MRNNDNMKTICYNRFIVTSPAPVAGFFVADIRDTISPSSASKPQPHPAKSPQFQSLIL